MREHAEHVALPDARAIDALLRETCGAGAELRAADALRVLEKLLGCDFVAADDTRLTGRLLRFSGDEGAVQTAYAGACLLLEAAERDARLPPDEARELEDGLRATYLACATHPFDPDAGLTWPQAAGFLAAAGSIFMEHPSVLARSRTPRQPERYFDSIYTDREAMFHHSPYALEEKLARAVTAGSEAQALAALREIAAHGEKAVLAKSPLRSAKNSLIGSIAFLSRAAIQAGVGANSAFALSDALTQQVEEMGEREEVLAFERELLVQFIALVRQRLEDAHTPPVLSAVHYVENHLCDRIRLADVAAYAGVHPVYLSARFKQETGRALFEYIMVRRMRESSYFVRHSGYSIAQIAAMYGFASQSYYIRCFKRVTGATPMRYRQRYLTE